MNTKLSWWESIRLLRHRLRPNFWRFRYRCWREKKYWVYAVWDLDVNDKIFTGINERAFVVRIPGKYLLSWKQHSKRVPANCSMVMIGSSNV